MKKELAEELLAKTMDWSDAEKAEERAFLESFASYKYDDYQQFVPGRRFVESLALWLRQFSNKQERDVAYKFVRERLIYISTAEINHLVGLAFPTYVRPKLMLDVSREDEALEPHQVKSIIQSASYKARLRKTLVLGLSDGARTDQFRRANPRDISHEQVFHAYDVSQTKAAGFTKKLRKDLKTIFGREPEEEEAKFQYVVLLDDFTASGTSYIRPGDKDGSWDGKIAGIIAELDKPDGLGAAIVKSGVSIIIVIYVAADQAIDHIKRCLDELKFSKGHIEFHVVHRLDHRSKLQAPNDDDILALAEEDCHFDEDADDEHSVVGGTSKRFGYAGCSLPVILSHNTPNNSIFLLWAEEEHSVLGLFPRVSRHRKFE